MKHVLAVCFLLFGLLLVACDEGQSDEDAPGMEAARRANTVEEATPTALPEDTAAPATFDASGEEVPMLAEVDGADGRLFFVHDDALYAGELAGEAATLIAEEVAPSSITLSPAGDHLIFGAISDEAPGIYLLNTASLELSQPVPAGHPWLRVGGWSPDGEWFTLQQASTAPVYVVSRDGQRVRQLGERADVDPENYVPPDTLQVAWLADNTLLVRQETYERVGETREGSSRVKSSATSYYAYDPASEERQALDIRDSYTLPWAMSDITKLSEGEALLAPLGRQFAVPYPPNRDVIVQGELESLILSPEELDPMARRVGGCTEHSLVTAGVRAPVIPDRLYAAPETTLLSDLQAAADGTIYFVRWFHENCADPATLQLELLALLPGEEAQVIGPAGDAVLGPVVAQHGYGPVAETVPQVALSPAGDYVAWLHHDLAAGESRLQIIDLENGAVETVLVTLASRELSVETEEQPYWVRTSSGEEVERTRTYETEEVVANGLMGVWWVE